MAATTSTGPPLADIDQSPTLLLASLFAARRSGDDLLARFYLRRLAILGIRVNFGVEAEDKDDGNSVVTGEART